MNVKRILSFFLCVTLVFSLLAVKVRAADTVDTAKRDRKADEIEALIDSLGTVAQESLTQLAVINEELLDFGYLYGNNQ